MHLIPFKGRNTSGSYNLNLLFNVDKSYIMDNHLAASWCWMQKLDPSKQYNLFHIDRHYDLLQSQLDWWLEELQRLDFNFTTISITDFLAIKYCRPDYPSEKYPLFRWDNYILIMHRLYPQLIGTFYFATHEDGDLCEELIINEKPIYELQESLSYWINTNKKNKWIVNLDIDYFFTDIDEQHFQFLTDEYILNIAKEIKNSWDNIAVLTVALSPEFCGGWDNATRVAKIITEHLGFSWSE